MDRPSAIPHFREVKKQSKNREKFLIAFGKNLRKIRLENGYSQYRLAELCDLDKNHIGNIERGESAPSIDTVRILAEVLKLKIPDLFDFKY